MEGFKINIGNNQITAAVNKGTVIITFSKDSKIYVTGSDDDSGVLLDWGSHEINEGDRLTIEKNQSDKTTVPKKSKVNDRSKLLAQYKELKTILSKKG